MSNITFDYIGASGQIFHVMTIERVSDTFFLNSGSLAFVNSPSFVQKQIYMPEFSGNLGNYRKVLDATSWNDSEYVYRVHNSGTQECLSASNFWLRNGVEAGPSGYTYSDIRQVSGVNVQLSSFYTPSLNIENAVWDAQQSSHVTNGTFGSGVNKISQDIYFADIKFVKDNLNLRDEYSVSWFKNNQIVTSGQITNPALSVFNTSLGTALISNGIMSYSSVALSSLRYNDAINVVASGEPYLVSVSGTIDGSNRVWNNVVGLDYL